MQFILPSRNKFVWPGILFTGLTFFLGIISLRRAGFGTDWARIRYLCLGGEYMMILEAGAIPQNIHLPPHLRLDRLSYLDRPDTRVAMPPLIDIMLNEKDRVRSLEEVLPSAERSDYKMDLGMFRTHSVSMSYKANDRYIRRRMGISEEDREKAYKEHLERLKQQKSTKTD